MLNKKTTYNDYKESDDDYFKESDEILANMTEEEQAILIKNFYEADLDGQERDMWGRIYDAIENGTVDELRKEFHDKLYKGIKNKPEFKPINK